eukprot:1176610-Amphidinium_carterae.3
MVSDGVLWHVCQMGEGAAKRTFCQTYLSMFLIEERFGIKDAECEGAVSEDLSSTMEGTAEPHKGEAESDEHSQVSRASVSM